MVGFGVEHFEDQAPRLGFESIESDASESELGSRVDRIDLERFAEQRLGIGDLVGREEQLPPAHLDVRVFGFLAHRQAEGSIRGLNAVQTPGRFRDYPRGVVQKQVDEADLCSVAIREPKRPAILVRGAFNAPRHQRKNRRGDPCGRPPDPNAPATARSPNVPARARGRPPRQDDTAQGARDCPQHPRRPRCPVAS